MRNILRFFRARSMSEYNVPSQCSISPLAIAIESTGKPHSEEWITNAFVGRLYGVAKMAEEAHGAQLKAKVQRVQK